MRRQPDFATAPLEPRLPAWEKLVLGAALVTLLLSGLVAWRWRAEAGDARARLAEVRRQVSQQAARERALVSTGGAGTRNPAATATPADIVAGIAEVLPPDARLERIAIRYADEVALELQVLARDAPAWDALLERFFRSSSFRDVEPGPELREAEVRSTIRARWSGGAR